MNLFQVFLRPNPTKVVKPVESTVETVSIIEPVTIVRNLDLF